MIKYPIRLIRATVAKRVAKPAEPYWYDLKTACMRLRLSIPFQEETHKEFTPKYTTYLRNDLLFLDGGRQRPLANIYFKWALYYTVEFSTPHDAMYSNLANKKKVWRDSLLIQIEKDTFTTSFKQWQNNPARVKAEVLDFLKLGENFKI